MAYKAEVLLDSIGPTGVRLTTGVLTYPRFVHSELLTHRALSRSSASSRAIPLAKMLAAVLDDPVIPIRWGSEARGMQQGAELEAPDRVICQCEWLAARDMAVSQARALAKSGLHKSLCNRLVEPWMWITVIVTATDWQNFFRLRCHPDAEPHIQKIAYMWRDAMEASVPTPRKEGEWHRPYVTGNDKEELSRELRVALQDPCDELVNKFRAGAPWSGLATGQGMTEMLNAISAARVARVSYLTHDGKRDWRKDLELADKLRRGSGFGHWAPTEHVAQAMPASSRRSDGSVEQSGNFRGWRQYRKTFQNECAPE